MYPPTKKSGVGSMRRLSGNVSQAGFTLIELLTAGVVFMVLAVMLVQLLNSTTTIAGISNKKQAADAQTRLIFSRMALDFGKMLKRPDVEYFFLKKGGNDRLAFVSEVTGYYPSAAQPGALSVISYRMGTSTDSYRGLERASKGLSWLSDASGEPAPIFRRDISEFCPEAVSDVASSNYEELGPGVVRFEYFFVLKNGELSATPWDTSAGHTKVDGLRDVASICVVLAVVDQSIFSKVTPADVQALAAKFPDFSPVMVSPGDLERSWQQAADADDITIKSGAGVRIHSRCFPLNL